MNQEKIILHLIKENTHITRKELAKETDLSVSSVDRYIKKLKDNGLIDRIGSNKAGTLRV
ncbi:MAG: winged helix-turn-helix transcriptional regulator [Bacilli bacterium]|nr:winged helix-turn-helix transcriptional regulator [Bacilli bacterium]